MAYEIGSVDNTGSEGLAHWQMLLVIKTIAEANGWTTLRYLNPTATDATGIRELIMKGVGLGGTDEIYIGFRAYQVATADYYNLSVAAFTGYVDANVFTSQPGYCESGIPAHNTLINYWIIANAQRISFCMRVGAANYESGYTGFYLPYATPGQYPYPICCIGMLNGVAATRYSDTNHSMGFKGYIQATNTYNGPNAKLRDVLGTWDSFYSQPTQDPTFNITRDTGGYYTAVKNVLYTAGNIWGELDGIKWASGFNQAAENTCMIDSVTHVLLRDVARTGFQDYFLMEMQ